MSGAEEARIPHFWRELPWHAWIARFGSPLFVFSAPQIAAQFRHYQATFTEHWPQTEWMWSYKTNYLAEVCQIFHAAGAGAEVVSAMEYAWAEKLRVPGDQIVFNGPHKPREVLARVVTGGGLVFLDHQAEIAELAQIAANLGREVTLGLRVNLNPADSPWARFGFDLASGQALAAAEAIANHPQLKLTALHTHLGTLITKPGRYGSAVRKLGEFARELRKKQLAEIDTLDLGGGFPSSILPAEGATSWTPAPIEHFAREIAGALHSAWSEFPPKLILETGRALIDDAAVLVTTVIGEKRLPRGEQAYLLDAGINVLPLATKQRLHVAAVVEHAGEEYQPATLFGPLCLPHDQLAADALLPPLIRGEQLLFWPVGAYNVTMMTPFITPCPAVILLDEERQPRVMRAMQGWVSETLQFEHSLTEAEQKK